MATRESTFINDFKEIARREPTPEARRKAATARFHQLEHQLELAFKGLPNADQHVERELTDLRRAMLIELDKEQPVTLGSLLDSLILLTRKRR